MANELIRNQVILQSSGGYKIKNNIGGSGTKKVLVWQTPVSNNTWFW